MRKRVAAAVLLASVASASVASASIVYDGFNYPIANLAGNTNPDSGTTWTKGGGSTDIAVVSGNLTAPIPGPAPTGNMVQFTQSGAAAERLGLPSGWNTTTGKLYYSLSLKVTNLTGAATGGAFIAGFNNNVGTATSSVTQAGARLQIRKSLTDTTKFNLGIRSDVATSTGTSTIGWDTTDFAAGATGDTVFVICDYEFNNSSNTDDVSNIWINPDPNAFYANGSLGAPTASSTGGDINSLQILSFFLRENTSAGNQLQMDELRLGTGQLDVFPAPEPGSLMALGAASLLLLNQRRREDEEKDRQ